MRPGSACALGLAAACIGAASADAQDWRTIQSACQLHDSGAYDVRITYAAGNLELATAEAPFLYQMRLHYDAQSSQAIHSLESDRVLNLGLKRATSVVWGGREDGETRMRVALTPSVPLDLSLQLGAVEADLDLGGLSLTSLEIESGASDTRIDFRTPNRVAMQAIVVKSGASGVKLRNIANANATLLRMDTGVGGVELDFSGMWTRNLSASVGLAFGTLRLIVPEDIGVRLEVGKLLARVTTDGLVPRDGALVSDNWDSARYRLTVQVRTVLGSVDLRRVSP